MRTYEYATVLLPSTPSAGGLAGTVELDQLNNLGAQGWEAFAAVPAALDGYAYVVTDGVHVFLRRSRVDAEQ